MCARSVLLSVCLETKNELCADTFVGLRWAPTSQNKGGEHVTCHRGAAAFVPPLRRPRAALCRMSAARRETAGCMHRFSSI